MLHWLTYHSVWQSVPVVGGGWGLEGGFAVSVPCVTWLVLLIRVKGNYSLLTISLIGALLSATNILDRGTTLCYQYPWSGHYSLLPISLIGALLSATNILDRGTTLCYQFLWSGHYSLLPVSLIRALFSANSILDRGTILCYQYLWSGHYSLLPISSISTSVVSLQKRWAMATVLWLWPSQMRKQQDSHRCPS